MKRNIITGEILIICGAVFSLLGAILFLVKGSSIVSIISLPLLFLGIIIWYNSRKALTKKDGRGSVIPKF